VFTNIFPTPSKPNAGFYVYEQVKGLQKYYDVKVVVALPQHPFAQRGNDRPLNVTFNNIEIFQLTYVSIPKISVLGSGYLYYLAVAKLIKAIHREFKFELIISYWTHPEGFAAVRFGKKFQVPVLIRPRGSDINLCIQNPFLRDIVKSTLNRADRVIPVSGALKKCITDLGVDNGKLSYIHNGIRTDEFYPMDRDVCRKKLQFPKDKKIIVYVGNLFEIKGIVHLLDAIQILEREYRDDMVFYFLGEGELESGIRQLQTDLGRISLHVVGDVPHGDLAVWLNAADVCCLPSLNEGCPNVVLESLACGLPVVATDVGGVPEIIDDPSLGILVSPRNAPALADALHKAVNSEWDRAELVDRVKNRSWDDVVMKLYDEIELLLTIS
jgi:glycosyltransferase involved in cell wall biosynthesis